LTSVASVRAQRIRKGEVACLRGYVGGGPPVLILDPGGGAEPQQ
jgi:hypothetical protein